MLAPDVISPDLAIGIGLLLAVLALWLWRPRRRVRVLCIECLKYSEGHTLQTGMDWLLDHECDTNNETRDTQ